MIENYSAIQEDHVLWHPWERAVLLKNYQFLIVSYKVLPPKTSGGKYLCGESYNGTVIDAPVWYLEWENEVESWTQRTFALRTVPNASGQTSTRHVRDTYRIKLPRILFPSQEKSYNVTSTVTNFAFTAETTTRPTISGTSTQAVRLLYQQVDNDAQVLRSHDQGMFRSGRLSASRNLCKQHLSSWSTADNEIFLNELGLDVERSHGIIN